jgi:transcriptional regulator with XRE-family HTH domain
MSIPPWLELSKMRTQRGLTQYQLAKGIVTQSMLCQIERGKTMPSRETLIQLAQRLGMNGETWAERWEVWREQSVLRQRLWDAALTDNVAEVERMLQRIKEWLSPYEIAVYKALVCTARDQLLEAEALLQAGQSRDEHAAAGDIWTWGERRRMDVIDAKVRAIIYEKCGRTEAMRIWRAVYEKKRAEFECSRDGSDGMMNNKKVSRGYARGVRI